MIRYYASKNKMKTYPILAYAMVESKPGLFFPRLVDDLHSCNRHFSTEIKTGKSSEKKTSYASITRLRPCALARYSAASAACTRIFGVSFSPGTIAATPILMVTHPRGDIS